MMLKTFKVIISLNEYQWQNWQNGINEKMTEKEKRREKGSACKQSKVTNMFKAKVTCQLGSRNVR